MNPEFRGQELCRPWANGQRGWSYLCVFHFCPTASGYSRGGVGFVLTFCLLLFFYCKVFWGCGMNTEHVKQTSVSDPG